MHASRLRWLVVLLALNVGRGFAAAPVQLAERDETIPTYLSGPPDPNPMFFFGRQSQGAEGHIYPYPLYDNLTNQKGEKSYHLVYLENEFIKIGIAPEIGGRLFSALDKTNGYDFVYRQHVIKPALIGLIGAWISGGIEWNIPHHHRASTFLPVQWRAVDNADGSKTIWVGELEVRHRMRWAVGYTLRPGSSVLECSVRVFNRTPAVNTMLCFANLAVTANETYQIIFPPSTQWVTFHAKNQFSEWPISHQRYSGADFTAGVDVSWYKNHIQPNSMFAWNYTDDFFAGYDHGRNAGTMSVADHHVVPGKKFWTWGSGPRGRMWDDILTDADGPYIELMVGAYSDNQPDYSWLQPFETRSFTLNWYPLREINGVKNANLEAAVNLEIKGGQANFGFNTTHAFPHALVRVTAANRVLLEEPIEISPAKPYAKQVAIPAGVDEHDVRVALLELIATGGSARSAGVPPSEPIGREIIGYSPVRLAATPQPPIYTPPPAPKDFKNDEELVLAGQRADQFHSPTLDPDPFWAEALRRDPGNIEANLGMGRLELRRAKFAAAETYFRKALERLTASYTTPKNAEPCYHLGVALKAQGKNTEAIDAFYKAVWSQEWKSPAYFSLAELATARGDFSAALEYVDRALDANALNVRACGLKAAILRHLRRPDEAAVVLERALRITDPLDLRLMAEQALLGTNRRDPQPFDEAARTAPAAVLELAADLANAGLWVDGTRLLTRVVAYHERANAATATKTDVSPLLYYYLADFAEKLGDATNAARYRRMAASLSPDYVFPFHWEVADVLQRALAANPQDARAAYYLGNVLFDWQPAEAIAAWEKSVAIDPTLPVAWRNLAQAYAHKPGDTTLQPSEKAIAALEKATALPSADATQFAELDQLYDAAGTPVEKRLERLDSHRTVVLRKDEGRAALVGLKTFVGAPDDAIALLSERAFSVWEGGTRFNTGQLWTDAHIVRGLQRLNATQFDGALADFAAALKLPANLRASENGPSAMRQAEVAYWTGLVHETGGDLEKARQAWVEAAKEPTNETGRAGRLFGNALAGRAASYYQALALQKLGETARAETIFHELIDAANKALVPVEGANDAPPPGRRISPRVRTATAHYIAGLGHAGLGEKEKARSEFTAALTEVPDHLGAKLARERL